MEIKKVGVLGCGLMGSGIAQVAAMAGLDVISLEVEQKFLDKGFAGIEKSLAKFAEKGTRSSRGLPGPEEDPRPAEPRTHPDALWREGGSPQSRCCVRPST